MFRQFHQRPLNPAWAGPALGSQFFASERFGRKGPRGGWGDGSRTRRGDMKFLLLELLAERSQHGYDLIKELENRRGGFRRVSAGSVYPTLQILKEGGYLTDEQLDGKRVYTITEAGRQLLSDRTSPLHSPESGDRSVDHKPSELIELRRTLTELNDAVTQVARNGNPERANQVRNLLVQVKREVYKILAED